MDSASLFSEMLSSPGPVTALAPMQDVTDDAFWKLMAGYGGPDVYYTEYFRVHPTSCLEKWILESITNNTSGKPAVAQMIGNDIPSLVRTAKELQKHNVAAIDLNLGCPAPVVYRKCAGGGLLRDPQLVDKILGALREAVTVKFTVKTRIGFDDPLVFDDFLKIFARHSLDLLTVHGRTVLEMYRSEVHYDFIARAVQAVNCPVLANGNIYSAARAYEIMKITGARGLMIGRGAIRNPWIFEQIRQMQRGEPVFVPMGRDVLEYIKKLYFSTQPEKMNEVAQVQKMKKYMNYIGIGVEPTGEFLHLIRRATREEEFFELCTRFMDHDSPMPLEPMAIALKPCDLLAGVHT
ncbi:MAG: tRNA-dihydrouridine synthase [Verrucomicrobiales bacterium]|nr:tRNA-dihydrouridine synthase [Verrucomicrobiales bacterium]